MKNNSYYDETKALQGIKNNAQIIGGNPYYVLDSFIIMQIK